MGVRFIGHTTCPHARAVMLQVDNTDQELCGASNVVKSAIDGPCGAAASGCAASGAMAIHGTIHTHDVTLCGCTLVIIATAYDVIIIDFYGAGATSGSTTMLPPTPPCNRMHTRPMLVHYRQPSYPCPQ